MMYILEVDQIPREKSKLQAVINNARRERRINQIKIWLSVILLVLSFGIMSISIGKTTATSNLRYNIYIPVVELQR